MDDIFLETLVDSGIDVKHIFEDMEIPDDAINKNPKYDLSLFYDKSNEEYLAQQDNVHKVFTLFIAIVSLITPYTLTANSFGHFSTTIMFFLISVVTYVMLFSLMHYQLKCELCKISMHTIMKLMNIKEERINSHLVQSVCCQVMLKKYSRYTKMKGKSRDVRVFNKKRIIEMNLSNSENVYFNIMLGASLLFMAMAFISDYVSNIAVLTNIDVLELFLCINIVLAFMAYGALYLFNKTVVFDTYRFMLKKKEYESKLYFYKTFSKMTHLQFAYYDDEE